MNSQTDVRILMSRYRSNAFGVGLLAAILAAAGAFLQPALFFPAYLVAFLFCWSIAVGCLALSLLHHLTGGGWGLTIRRVLEAGCGTIRLLAVLFVPLLCGMNSLYVWARPDAVEGDISLLHKAPYLNVNFFAIRAAIYFAVWIALAWSTNRLTATTDTTQSARRRDWLAAISGPGMVLWGLTVTFAAMDWTMSLEPHWISSIHGLIFMAGQAVSGLAFALVVVIHLSRLQPVACELNESRLHDLGNLLLACTLFWSYVSFTQYLVIWSGNLPAEVDWYLRRERGGWQLVAVLLIGLHFAIPFLLLLSRPIKRHTRSLFGIAALLLSMRLVEFYWQVMPTFSTTAWGVNWLTFCAPVAVGGVWIAAFANGLNKRLALPLRNLHPIEEFQDDRVGTAAS